MVRKIQDIISNRQFVIRAIYAKAHDEKRTITPQEKEEIENYQNEIERLKIYLRAGKTETKVIGD